ncbi:MAG: Dabb family protein [Bacteroidales bacterium]
MTTLQNRRSFIGTTAKGMAAAGLLTASSCADTGKRLTSDLFIHHVYFWLKHPVTLEMRTKFEGELRKLVTVETIVDYHLGVPAPTGRDVIDNTYSYSLLTIFRNKADQDIYQTHPTHLKFIEESQDLWEKVVVYDSIGF